MTIHSRVCVYVAKKFKKVLGKEIYSDTLASTSMLEKEKFPQDYFPEVCLFLLVAPLVICVPNDYDLRHDAYGFCSHSLVFKPV